jgi:hypothetical protein
MDDPLPNFDSPAAPTEPAPRKPRQRPTRKKRVPKPAAVKLARKRRKPRSSKVVPAAEEVFLSDAVYRTIRTLVDLTPSERGMVLAIVNGLTK